MAHETVPTNRRIYLTFASASAGMALVKMSYTPPAIGEAFVAILSRGMILCGDTLQIPLVSDPAAVGVLKGQPGKDASAYLGTIAIAQTAGIQIAAGVRRVSVAIPVAMGVAAGDSLIACPTQALAGFAVHDVVAVSATHLSVGVTAPLLAIGAGYSIAARLYRLSA